MDQTENESTVLSAICHCIYIVTSASERVCMADAGWRWMRCANNVLWGLSAIHGSSVYHRTKGQFPFFYNSRIETSFALAKLCEWRQKQKGKDRTGFVNGTGTPQSLIKLNFLY
jgi:hypothetical protein